MFRTDDGDHLEMVEKVRNILPGEKKKTITTALVREDESFARADDKVRFLFELPRI